MTNSDVLDGDMDIDADPTLRFFNLLFVIVRNSSNGTYCYSLAVGTVILAISVIRLPYFQYLIAD